MRQRLGIVVVGAHGVAACTITSIRGAPPSVANGGARLGRSGRGAKRFRPRTVRPHVGLGWPPEALCVGRVCACPLCSDVIGQTPGASSKRPIRRCSKSESETNLVRNLFSTRANRARSQHRCLQGGRSGCCFRNPYNRLPREGAARSRRPAASRRGGQWTASNRRPVTVVGCQE